VWQPCSVAKLEKSKHRTRSLKCTIFKYWIKHLRKKHHFHNKTGSCCNPGSHCGSLFPHHKFLSTAIKTVILSGVRIPVVWECSHTCEYSSGKSLYQVILITLAQPYQFILMPSYMFLPQLQRFCICFLCIRFFFCFFGISQNELINRWMETASYCDFHFIVWTFLSELFP